MDTDSSIAACEVTLLHEIEAGFSPTTMIVMGEHVPAEAFYPALIKALDECDVACIEQDHEYLYRPRHAMHHGYQRAEWWDEDGNETYGTLDEARATVPKGDPYGIDSCAETAKGATPCTWVELTAQRNHERAEFQRQMGKADDAIGAARAYLRAVDHCKVGGRVEFVQAAEVKMREALDVAG